MPIPAHTKRRSNPLLIKFAIFFFILLNIGCDQISKDMVRNNVAQHDYIQVIGDYFIMTKVENTGAIMGFGEQFSPLIKNILFKFLPVVILLILLTRILKKKELNLWLIIAFAFVIGGGIGNLIDRIAYGSVTDFFQIKMGLLRTGIFNMADVSVTIGALLILILSIKGQKIDP